MDNRLWKAIYGLYALLVDGVTKESEFQKFFEENPVVFEVLGFTTAKSFEKRSGNRLPYDQDRKYQPEPDFLCANAPKGELVVFEIKTPIEGPLLTSRADGQREKLRADVEGYVSQTTEYVRFIEGDRVARNAACQQLGIKAATTVSGILVYGRSNEEELPRVAHIAAGRTPRIDIMTYDQLLDRLADAFARVRSDVILGELFVRNGVPGPMALLGMTFAVSAILPQRQPRSPAYIFDMGAVGGVRLSFYIENGAGCLKIVDGLNREHLMHFDVPVNVPFLFKLEISTDPARSFFLVSVDEQEVELRQMSKGAPFDPDVTNFTLGSDLNGAQGSKFRVLENMQYSTTLSLRDRLGILHYATRKNKREGMCVEFNEHQYLRLGASGELIQGAPELQPYRHPASEEWID